jgi:oligopeptide transport system ATP-binding protein
MADEILLETRNLTKHFPLNGRRGPGVRAVENVSLTIRKGETLGLVGESGCGKSTLGRTILRLDEPTSGQIIYGGTTIYDSSRHRQPDMLPYRRSMQIIFQDPASCLDPRMTVGESIGEALAIHRLCHGRIERGERVRELLASVGLRAGYAGRYPHELSGGQQQRVGIARALAVKPEFIVCDEPVSALDVSIQAQVVNLLEDLQRDMGLTYLFISHNLSIIRHISDQIGIMYLGRLVELGESWELTRRPLHPYTKALLSAVPVPDPRTGRSRLYIVPEGDPPSALNPPSGCRFHTRCPHAVESCRQAAPMLSEYTPGHWVACHLLG